MRSAWLVESKSKINNGHKKRRERVKTDNTNGRPIVQRQNVTRRMAHTRTRNTFTRLMLFGVGCAYRCRFRRVIITLLLSISHIHGIHLNIKSDWTCVHGIIGQKFQILEQQQLVSVSTHRERERDGAIRINRPNVKCANFY